MRHFCAYSAAVPYVGCFCSEEEAIGDLFKRLGVNIVGPPAFHKFYRKLNIRDKRIIVK